MVSWHSLSSSKHMKRLITYFLLLMVVGSSTAQTFTIGVDDLLKKRTNSAGLVDYAYIKKNPEHLNSLLTEIAKAPILQDNDEKAFLINVYNIFVIKGIVDHYPVEGPLAIDGFFEKKHFNLRGANVSLNELEKEILVKQFPDPRLHFALVCAAKGCPKLASFSYNGKGLDEQLEAQTRNVVNDPDFIRTSGPQLTVSKIFEWYAEDFGGLDKIVPFIQKYHRTKVKFSTKFTYYDYDWSLNERK